MLLGWLRLACLTHAILCGGSVQGNLVPEDNVNGICSSKRHQSLHM